MAELIRHILSDIIRHILNHDHMNLTLDQSEQLRFLFYVHLELLTGLCQVSETLPTKDPVQRTEIPRAGAINLCGISKYFCLVKYGCCYIYLSGLG